MKKNSFKNSLFYGFFGILVSASGYLAAPDVSKNQVEKPAENITDNNADQEVVKKMEERENEKLSMYSVNGSLHISILSSAKGTSEMVNENIQRISIPVGSQNNVECTLRKGYQSPAQISRDFFEKIRGKSELDKVSVKNSSAGVLGKLPYIYMETQYFARDQLYGVIKSVSLTSAGFSVTCFHDELGYKKTFLKSVESLANAITKKESYMPSNHFTSRHINLILINDKVAGIMENMVIEEDKNITNYYSTTNIFFPVSSTEIVASESIDDVFIDKKTGNLISGKYYSSKNEKEEYRIELKEIPPVDYGLKGNFTGKNLDEKIRTPYKIHHFEYIANHILANPAFKNKKIIQFWEYLAGDPRKIFLSTIHVKSASDKLIHFSYESEKAKMQIEVDISGILHVQMGGDKETKINIDRILAE